MQPAADAPPPPKKKPWRYSYSQLDTLECPAKFAFKYVEGRREPPTPAAAFGTRSHDFAYTILRGGQADTRTAEGKVGAELAAMTPQPWGRLIIEPEYDWAEHDAGGELVFLSKPDLWIPGELHSPDASVAWIGDYKTTGKIGPYTMTNAALPTAIQSTLYGRWAFATGPALERVEFQWMTVDRSAKGKRVAQASVTRAENAEQFERLRVAARTARSILLQQTPGRDAEQNREVCGKYGGCPYQAICPSGNVLFGNFGHNPFLESSSAEPMTNPVHQFAQSVGLAPQAQSVGLTPVAPAQPTYVQGVGGTPFPPGAQLVHNQTGAPARQLPDGRIEVATQSGSTAFPPGWEAQFSMLVPPPAAPPPAEPAAWAPPAINPPESQPNTNLQQSAQTYVDVARQEKRSTPVDGMNPEAAAAVQAAMAGAAAPVNNVVAIVAAPPPAPEAKPKRTRRTKAEMEAARAAAPGTAPAAQLSEGVVFVDCAPVGVPVQSYGEVFETARAAIEAETKIAHPSAFEYGKGTAALYAKFQVAEVEAWVAVDSNAYGSALLVSVLEARGYVVVR